MSTMATGRTGPRVRVQCPGHPNEDLEIQSDPEAWGVGVLGAMETGIWPIVIGWLSVLDASAADAGAPACRDTHAVACPQPCCPLKRPGLLWLEMGKVAGLGVRVLPSWCNVSSSLPRETEAGTGLIFSIHPRSLPWAPQFLGRDRIQSGGSA